jgi:hypothetical protein
MPRPLYPLGKGPHYPVDRRLAGPQSRSGRRSKRKFLSLPGLELRPFGRPARSQSVYRLSCPGSVRKVHILIIFHEQTKQLLPKQLPDYHRGARFFCEHF